MEPNRRSARELAGPEGQWVNQKRNLETAALFLLLKRDEVPRTYGDKQRDVPPGALHAKRIQLGIGFTLAEDDLPEPNQFYLSLRKDRVHFYNPQEEAGLSRYERAGCFALTPEGEKWAKALLEDYERGFKRWLKPLFIEWGEDSTRSPWRRIPPKNDDLLGSAA
jgi:hypothetical protein